MEKRYWLDDTNNIKRLLRGFYVVCAILLAVDLIYHRHAETAFDGWFGFYGIYGFVACVVLVLVATQMRKVLSRPEDHYGDEPESDDAR